MASRDEDEGMSPRTRAVFWSVGFLVPLVLVLVVLRGATTTRRMTIQGTCIAPAGHPVNDIFVVHRQVTRNPFSGAKRDEEKSSSVTGADGAFSLAGDFNENSYIDIVMVRPAGIPRAIGTQISIPPNLLKAGDAKLELVNHGGYLSGSWK